MEPFKPVGQPYDQPTTRRDLYIAAAMTGLLARGQYSAKSAIGYAEDLLAVLNLQQ